MTMTIDIACGACDGQCLWHIYHASLHLNSLLSNLVKKHSLLISEYQSSSIVVDPLH